MPGMFNPMFLSGNKKPITTCVKQASSSYLGANDSITLPAGIQAGDLIIIQGSVNNGASISADFVLPAGYTLIGKGPPDYQRSFACFKIAIGSESSTTLTGLSSSAPSHTYLCTVFRASLPLVSAIGASFQSERTNATPTPQVIPCGSAAVPLLAVSFISYGVGFTMTPSDATETVTTNRYVGWKFYASGATPANVTVSAGDAGSGNLMASYYLSLTA
jgi:hypothetical protein